MGCVSSKTDINDLHANIFEVMNVDELGHRVSHGTIELTESELVLYQGDSTITRWPLRCLRRYGFDAEIFSFESGRRCPSGSGIYAFRCRRAEQLFNLLQQYIHLRNLHDELIIPSSGVSNDLARLSGLSEAPQRPPSARLSRPGSLTSNGPISPSALPEAEHNNNKRNTNTSLQLTYSNATQVDLPATPSDCCHLYMNITPGAEEQDEEPVHCYANLEIETLRPPSPTTPTRKVNYIELDLDEAPPSIAAAAAAAAAATAVTIAPLPPPESPKNPPTESYATIDFNKTNALSQSVNPNLELVNEGSRKTRHNSTIDDLNTRHSNSLSD